jgi:hypothetical protein
MREMPPTEEELRERLKMPKAEKRTPKESAEEFGKLLEEFLSFHRDRIAILKGMEKETESKEIKADLQDILTKAESDVGKLEQMKNEMMRDVESLQRIGEDLGELWTQKEFLSNLPPEQKAFFQEKPKMLKPIEIRFPTEIKFEA